MTIIALLAIIGLVRLFGTGRLANAWAAIWQQPTQQ